MRLEGAERPRVVVVGDRAAVAPAFAAVAASTGAWPRWLVDDPDLPAGVLVRAGELGIGECLHTRALARRGRELAGHVADGDRDVGDRPVRVVANREHQVRVLG